MEAETFVKIIGADFFAGVPDSQLKALCSYLFSRYGIDPRHHVIAANEGNCAALAAGYYLASGKPAVVYMQNSGEGNIINPLASLANAKVYAIPMLFIIGWRGEPGVHDEPQHIYQGLVTVKLMEDMEVKAFVIGPHTTEAELAAIMEEIRPILEAGKQAALIIRKGALQFSRQVDYKNSYLLNRERVIEHIVAQAGCAPIISTTGKISRELFEIRERMGLSHAGDFLTVGSMGHCSSIALGVALHKPDKKIWCIDGDGAMLMHMGALAVIGSCKPTNLVHIVINNGAHETVGGMPTVADHLDVPTLARACGYPYAVSVEDYEHLDMELEGARNRSELSLIEVRCQLGSRADLGRPTGTARENKHKFMEYLKNL